MFNNQIVKFCLLGLFIVPVHLISLQSYAQTGSRLEAPSVKSQVAKIILSGLGGAVLGISTLSFYDKPQDHLSNVAIGGALGVALGSVYVTRESLEQEPLSTWDQGGSINLALVPDRKNYRSLDGVGFSWGFAF